MTVSIDKSNNRQQINEHEISVSFVHVLSCEVCANSNKMNTEQNKNVYVCSCVCFYAILTERWIKSLFCERFNQIDKFEIGDVWRANETSEEKKYIYIKQPPDKRHNAHVYSNSLSLPNNGREKKTATKQFYFDFRFFSSGHGIQIVFSEFDDNKLCTIYRWFIFICFSFF